MTKAPEEVRTERINRLTPTTAGVSLERPFVVIGFWKKQL